MAWPDRLQEAAYTSPTGVRTPFAYEAVSRETPLRGTAFGFPLVNDSYVQRNGFGSRKYPMRAIFFGDNCDLEATAFEAALFESGLGRLEHPLYGTFNVVPFGDVSRRDDLKQSANEAIVEVTFWTTTAAVYPSSQSSPRNEIMASLVAFNTAVATQFASSASLQTVASRANTVASTRSMLSKVKGGLEDIASATAAISQAFEDLERAISFGLDVLILNPLELALQVADLVQIPARAAASIAARLAAFETLASSVRDSPAGRPSVALAAGAVLPRRNVKVANDFFVADLFGSSSTSGAILSAVETRFATRPQAIAAAEVILQQVDECVVWRDVSFASLAPLGKLDTGASYQALLNAAALTAGFLVEVSFSLVPEKSVVLERNRTIVDLAAELYGAVDSRLDFLIETNDLSGSEILELPAGRRIVYYP
jgi:prophage DNA circulation protein